MAKLLNSQLVEDLKFLAEVYGWHFERHEVNSTELYFKKDGCGMTIWYAKMTVRTALTHPKQGTTQMYRKRVDMGLMEELFDNPRTHTNKGYLKKEKANRAAWRKTNNTDLNNLRQRYISPRGHK